MVRGFRCGISSTFLLGQRIVVCGFRFTFRFREGRLDVLICGVSGAGGYTL